MTRKSKRQHDDSDEEFNTIDYIEYSPDKQHRDYFDELFNVYEQLEDHCYDQSLHFLDNGTFEDFCELVYQFVPETRPEWD